MLSDLCRVLIYFGLVCALLGLVLLLTHHLS